MSSKGSIGAKALKAIVLIVSFHFLTVRYKPHETPMRTG